MLFGILMLMFKGVVGVIGSGFIILVVMFVVFLMILVEGIVLLIGVDCFMLEVCVIINLIGNGVVIVVVLKMENEFYFFVEIV